MWLFTLEVSLAGQAPFPAVFGHRVPLAKLASVAPGVKLAVAVDETDKNEEVAIDWDQLADRLAKCPADCPGPLGLGGRLGSAALPAGPTRALSRRIRGPVAGRPARAQARRRRWPVG